jgi:Holliday junction DNA helicase RuvA
MIASIRGEVIQVEDNAIVVEVGGVGLRVFVPAQWRGRLTAGEGVVLFTHLVVREDALTLYGFESQGERDLFNLLLGVDGVGPRVSLSVLSTLDLETVQRAVLAEESEVLARVPGVGKKTAQKIVLYLHDRLQPVEGLSKLAALSDQDGEVLAALTALGYSVVEAQGAIQSLPKDAPENVEERLRLALQHFTG